MSEERQKSVVAALLAVHSGLVSPDEAVAALKEPGKASSLVEFDDETPMVVISGDHGEFLEVPIIDVINDPVKQKRALRDIGISDSVQETLFTFAGNGNSDAEYGVLRDTFKQVAGSARRLGDSEIRPAREPEAGSESPTQAPKDKTGVMRLTTGKFFPNFGIDNERYDIRREHARGGMGRIMLARDKAIGRDIALKELLPGLVTGTSSIPGSVPNTNDTGGVVERFMREAKITAQLEHPNIVPVYEIGKHADGTIYYTMRFVRGVTLSDRLREIRKDESLAKKEKLAARIRLLDSFIDVCQAIAYAHSKGVIHRDLKPENIMLGDFGETQVLDWGLARIKGQEDKALKDLQKGSLALSKSLLQSDSQALTLDGSIVGTPAYMAPEQARGELENVDEQSDVYALGAVLYQVLTGFPPYEGPMAALIVQQVLAGPPLRVSAREKDIPPELEALVEKAMAREKKDRIRSALELASEVKAFRDGRTLGSYQYSAGEMIRRFMRQNRTTVGVVVLGVLLLVAGTIFFMQRLTEQRDQAEIARADADAEKAVAQGALKLADEERAERERVEREARDAAQKELESRVEEAERMMKTIEGMRIEPAIADLRARLAEYELQLAGPPARTLLELSVDEQVGNSVLLSNILGFVSAKQNLVDLLTGPAGTRLPKAVAQIDLDSERAELDQIRLDTARFATINGDFPLALLLLTGSSLPPERLSAEKTRVQEAQKGLLDLHDRRITEALVAAEGGLNGEWRKPDAPNLEEYVKRLSSYRERQTVERLKSELDSLLKRDVSTWNRPRFDMAIIALRVLGNVDLPSEAVPVLGDFLHKNTDAELVYEASNALCATGSTDAFDVLVNAMRRRGLDYWREIEDAFAALPMPVRVRDPKVVADWIDRSVALRARKDFGGAELAANNALLMDEKSAEALLHRALAHRASDRPGYAEADLNRALEFEPEFYEAMLERGRLLNARPGVIAKVDDLTAAINLRPNDWRGYRARGDVYARRFKVAEAVADYDQAIGLEPTRLELYLEYSERLRDNNKWREAEAVLGKAVDRWPEDWRTWSARAWLRREGNLGGAIEDARKGTALNALDAKSWNVMCQVLWGNYAHLEGIEAGKRSVEADPQEWLAWYYLGLHWHHMSEQADNAWRATQGRDAEGGIKGQESSGTSSRETFLRQRETTLTNAADNFMEALKIEPEDFRTSYLLADTLIQLERYDDAYKVCNEALTYSPFCYMRWGGSVVSEVRFWADALEYRNLLTTEPRNAHERIGKALMLAIAGGASTLMVHEERQNKQLDDACRLLAQAAAEVAQGKAEVLFYCYASDRLLDSLMRGGGRAWYFEAVKECERREKLGRFLDADFYARYAIALAGVSEMYRVVKYAALAENGDIRAEFDSLNMSLLTRRREEYRDRAAAAVVRGAEVGLRVGALPREDSLPLLIVKELENWDEINAALRAAPLATPAGESIYDELMLLVNVVEGGPAEIAGLQKFDQIVKVGEVTVRTTEDFMGTWGPIVEGTEVVLHVRRIALKGGVPVPVMGADGKPLVDEHGFVTWQTEEFDVTVKRGFLGINLGQGMVPPRFRR
jgi:serine/threonine protein kinase